MKKFDIKSVKEYIENLGGKCLSSEYIDSKKPLDLLCPSCETVFPRSFDNIKTRKRITCKPCSCKTAQQKNSLDYNKVKDFVEKNNCKLLSGEYENVDSTLKFECRCGNQFETSFYKFDKRDKRQCNDCGLEIIKRKTLTPESEIIPIIENEGYEYLGNDASGKDQKVLIKCSNNHSPYWVRFVKFKRGGRCPDCKRSLGEEFVLSELIKYKVEYNTQQTFNDLRGIGNMPLRYDFSLFKNGKIELLIEYDGKQHFELSFDDEIAFERTKKHDIIKNDYAKSKKIPLYRIPYTEYHNIPIIIKEIIDNHYSVVEDIV